MATSRRYQLFVKIRWFNVFSDFIQIPSQTLDSQSNKMADVKSLEHPTLKVIPVIITNVNAFIIFLYAKCYFYLYLLAYRIDIILVCCFYFYLQLSCQININYYCMTN